MGELRQYYIGSFNVVLNDLEMQYLEKHVEHLVRKDRDKKDFEEIVRILKSKNLVFNDLMETPNGHTYLAALTLMNVNKVDNEKN